MNTLKLTTPVTDIANKVGISYKDRIMMLGSCFSDNIGKLLENYGFDVSINPFGTLYNPVSILKSIRRLISCRPFTSEECVKTGSGSDLYCSFSHHTSFARPDESAFLENANMKLEEASGFFHNCNKIIITLGTAWCFRHKADGEIVSNCLKRNAAEFSRERLGVEEIAGCIESMVNESRRADNGKQFIFTVSPIRHLSDGAHGNQLSKASLLLAAEAVCSQDSGCDYFPAYEIMTDELRDYRFYAEDMLHPSAQAVNYMGDRFLNWALPAGETDILEAHVKEYRHRCHIVKNNYTIKPND